MPRTGPPSDEPPWRKAQGGARGRARVTVARDGVVTICDRGNPGGIELKLSSDDWHKLKALLERGAFEFKGTNTGPANANTPAGVSKRSRRNTSRRNMKAFEFFAWLVEYATQSDLMLFRCLILAVPFVLGVCLTRSEERR